MENKLGRKNMAEWSKTVQAVMDSVYKDAFHAGYDAAKDETLDIDTMAQHLVDRYNDEGLSNLMMIVDKIRPRRVVISANQQRAELIERAREFIDEGMRKFQYYPYRLEFVVNAKKRTIVALVVGKLSKVVVGRHVAKCMPGEVFNVDIGKAIALARALDIEVPQEFLNAVQPEVKVEGMKVMTFSDGVKTIVSEENYRCDSGLCTVGSVNGVESTIVDDTNAKY